MLLKSKNKNLQRSKSRIHSLQTSPNLLCHIQSKSHSSVKVLTNIHVQYKVTRLQSLYNYTIKSLQNLRLRTCKHLQKIKMKALRLVKTKDEK